MVNHEFARLDLNQVARHFEKLHYRILDLKQSTRYVIGRISKDNRIYFLKLSLTKDTSPKAKNECEWNKIITESVPPLNIKFKVPKVSETGEYNGLFWFLTDYIEGSPLLHVHQADEAEKLIPYLGQFAESAKAIINLKLSGNLPNDTKSSIEESRKKYLATINKWISESKMNLSQLLSFIERNIEFTEFASTHGDFVPWHTIKTSSEDIYLIDGEHAKTDGVKFYDVAYMYHRLYTKLRRPDIADSFLKEFRRTYTMSSTDTKCFNFILGQRIVGGYFDATHDHITDLKLQDELSERLLAGVV